MMRAGRIGFVSILSTPVSAGLAVLFSFLIYSYPALSITPIEARHRLLATLRRAGVEQVVKMQLVHWENASVSRKGFQFDVKWKDPDDASKYDSHIRVDFASFNSSLHENDAWLPCGGNGYFQIADDRGNTVSDHWGQFLNSNSCIPPFDETFGSGLIQSINSLIQNAKHTLSQDAIEQVRQDCTSAIMVTALSPEAEAQSILAKNAVQEKQFDDALDYYNALLQLQPCFADAHFNAALIASELGFYDEAIDHMNQYLQLVPNSADAEPAKEKIIIWQEKAREGASPLE